jgi:hypothetical protein
MLKSRRLVTMDIKITMMVVFLSSLASCSSTNCVFSEDVIRNYNRYVDKSNGVTEKEAGIIAQYEMVQRGETKSYFLNIFNKIKEKDSYVWLVTFQAFHDGAESGQAIDVCVDKRNGSITCWNKRPLIIKEGKIEHHGPFVTQKIEAE